MPDLFEYAETEPLAEKREETVQHNLYIGAKLHRTPVGLPASHQGTGLPAMGADVRDFHERFGLEYNGPIRLIPDDLFEFRVKFMFEEILELAMTDDPADELDAFVDLAYVAVGSVYLHGVDFDTEASTSTFTKHIGRSMGNRVRPREGMKTAEVGRLMNTLAWYTRIRHHDFDEYLNHLIYIPIYCHQCVMHRGLDFAEAWARVQRANMAKVRVQRPEDSKRGSGFDVIKPPGWTAPDHSDLVTDMRQET